ncbi:hypothetical protein NDU88_000601 [Pleurodeles waltl]|uniref:Uncharacterized protein n=1 Tax=Pleurodeles waltl TaxID=8319 RepID=A0AAV7S938_PLEWA|nr:hypothetical protein NDU88_000601 [Pleurodeles waltl]
MSGEANGISHPNTDVILQVIDSSYQALENKTRMVGVDVALLKDDLCKTRDPGEDVENQIMVLEGTIKELSQMAQKMRYLFGESCGLRGRCEGPI